MAAARLYILDTNILVHMVREDVLGQQIKDVYDLLMTETRPLLSVVTHGELRSLAYYLEWGEDKKERAAFLLGYFGRVPTEKPSIIEAYAMIDAFSEKQGRSMGKNDVWIAAAAHDTGATLLTTDKDFDHLDPLFLSRIWIDPARERRSRETLQ